MNTKRMIFCLLAAVLLASCSGVEMVPAPMPTLAPTQPALPQAPAAPSATQPAVKETPALIAPSDETPNPNPDDRVQPPDGPNVQKPPASFQPQPGDARLQEAAAFVDDAELVTLKQDPYTVALHISGSLPTPCHQLRVKTAQPDRNKRIVVTVYSVVNPEMICTQVLELFEISVPLDSYPAGKYTLEVNGEKAGEIVMP